ncbi:potassium-transporting ATPase subunit KdpA, partial [Bacillus pseudomycoides]|nr:potassium-transporting ATPase subunit KdpA [Bacillus pseudomycoides]
MNWLRSLIRSGIFVIVAKPMGDYIYNAVQRKEPFQEVFGPLETILFKVAWVKGHSQTWKQYMFCLMRTNFFCILAVYSIFRFQGTLPLNPNHFVGLEPTLAFHTAITFTAN